MSHDLELGGMHIFPDEKTWEKIEENILLCSKRVEEDTDQKVELKEVRRQVDRYGNTIVKAHTEVWIGGELKIKRRCHYELMIFLMNFHKEFIEYAIKDWARQAQFFRTRG